MSDQKLSPRLLKQAFLLLMISSKAAYSDSSALSINPLLDQKAPLEETVLEGDLSLNVGNIAGKLGVLDLLMMRDRHNVWMQLGAVQLDRQSPLSKGGIGGGYRYLLKDELLSDNLFFGWFFGGYVFLKGKEYSPKQRLSVDAGVEVANDFMQLTVNGYSTLNNLQALDETFSFSNSGFSGKLAIYPWQQMTALGRINPIVFGAMTPKAISNGTSNAWNFSKGLGMRWEMLYYLATTVEVKLVWDPIQPGGGLFNSRTEVGFAMHLPFKTDSTVNDAAHRIKQGVQLYNPNYESGKPAKRAIPKQAKFPIEKPNNNFTASASGALQASLGTNPEKCKPKLDRKNSLDLQQSSSTPPVSEDLVNPEQKVTQDVLNSSQIATWVKEVKPLGSLDAKEPAQANGLSEKKQPNDTEIAELPLSENTPQSDKEGETKDPAQRLLTINTQEQYNSNQPDSKDPLNLNDLFVDDRPASRASSVMSDSLRSSINTQEQYNSNQPDSKDPLNLNDLFVDDRPASRASSVMSDSLRSSINTQEQYDSNQPDSKDFSNLNGFFVDNRSASRASSVMSDPLRPSKLPNRRNSETKLLYPQTANDSSIIRHAATSTSKPESTVKASKIPRAFSPSVVTEQGQTTQASLVNRMSAPKDPKTHSDLCDIATQSHVNTGSTGEPLSAMLTSPFELKKDTKSPGKKRRGKK